MNENIYTDRLKKIKDEQYDRIISLIQDSLNRPLSQGELNEICEIEDIFNNDLYQRRFIHPYKILHT